MGVRVITAPRTAGVLLAVAAALAAASQVWPGRVDLLAWILMGVIAGFSLSGSV
ncbi:hypothetical protein Acor_15870 [Acrocarpospora corrugata]|uniref:Uncharacterized protein n=1 Tax=Acrocarpospora corrugata TaxID=35763 RepID=A0A5M3VSM5_9ACTN|nr:hypothetical protein [Acrocarpospora corrugata]GER99523.1 hypothetical protein Acor_15870 [Acrocarpospora corrugata]